MIPRFAMQALSCTHAAVETGPSGLCGITSTLLASAIAAIFLDALIPPTAHHIWSYIPGRLSLHEDLNSLKYVKRSPVAIGMFVFSAT